LVRTFVVGTRNECPSAAHVGGTAAGRAACGIGPNLLVVYRHGHACDAGGLPAIRVAVGCVDSHWVAAAVEMSAFVVNDVAAEVEGRSGTIDAHGVGRWRRVPRDVRGCGVDGVRPVRKPGGVRVDGGLSGVRWATV